MSRTSSFLIAMTGGSGSGKSTTARVITGLLPPMEGHVEFQGTPLPRDYKSRSKDQLRQAQMIYQMADTALNNRLKELAKSGLPIVAVDRRPNDRSSLTAVRPHKLAKVQSFR